MPLSLSDPGLRAELHRLIAKASDWEAERVEIVASWLENLPAHESIGFYGCGSLAQKLAVEHPDILRKRPVRFFSTQQEGLSSFHGFPKSDLAAVLAEPPKHIALLSATYHHAMRNNLAPLQDVQIYGLEDIVANHVRPQVLQSCLERMQKEAQDVRAQLVQSIPVGERTLCIQMMNFGSVYRLKPFRRIKEAGYRLAVFAPRNAAFPIPPDDMIEQGYVDFIYTAPSDETLQLVLLLLLEEDDLFTLFEFPKHFSNIWYIAKVTEVAKAKTIAYADNFLSTFFENKDHAREFSSHMKLEKSSIETLYESFFRHVNALIYKDSSNVLNNFCNRFSARPQCLHFLPYIEGGMLPHAPHERYSQKDGITRIAFAHSLHQGFYKEWYDKAVFKELIARITDTGLGFTVFNSMDKNGSGWEEFMELEQQNPLFAYRSCLPYDQLLDELRYYDFGWLGFLFPQKASDFVRTNLQLKIFAYAQAGLPTIVSPEFEYCEQLLQQYGLGLALPAHDLENLPVILNNFDRTTCQNNIESFCRQLSVDNHVGDMITFYNILADVEQRS